MLAKKEFIDQFGLGNYPTYLPQERAPWLLTDNTPIPTAWQVSESAIRDEHWQQWENVLYQPETKKIQKLFLEHLARPETMHILQLSDDAGTAGTSGTAGTAGASGTAGTAYTAGNSAQTAETETLVIYIRRPQADEALSLGFKIPAGRKARLVFVEKAYDSGDVDVELRSNLTIYARVEEGASLDINYIHPFYKAAKAAKAGEAGESISYLKKDAYKLCLYKVDVAKDASFTWTSVNLGDSLIEKGEVRLNGSGASANVGGAAYIQAEADQLYQAHIYCAEPYSHCRIQNHGVVEDLGTGTFVSISDIAKGAHGTEAREDNRFMTLGDKAKAFVDPTLLIDEYDVKASHAATVGQVDEDALFYLRSRGLDLRQASRLMTAGFLTPLFDRITLPELRRELLAQFYEKMHLEEILGEDDDE